MGIAVWHVLLTRRLLVLQSTTVHMFIYFSLILAFSTLFLNTVFAPLAFVAPLPFGGLLLIPNAVSGRR